MHHPTTMMEINDDIISDMEKFTQTVLASRLQMKDFNERTICFGHIFASKPDEFQFVVGDRILLKQLALRVKNILEQRGLDYFDEASHQQSIQIKVCPDITQQSRTHRTLENFLLQANRNCTRKKQGYRFDGDVQKFATYIRMLGGPLCYETLHANLQCALPSLGSTNRYIRKSHFKVNEAVVRCYELAEYLKEQNLPMIIALSEDATRIVERIQYDRCTNQIIGFTLPLRDGMPIPFSYPARGFTEITKHFTSGNSSSSLMNVIMAQPLANTTPFCLFIYGSDNKYTAHDVYMRWKTIAAQLKELGISVLTVSSDSDPRYNSAMRASSNLGIPSEIFATEYFCSGDVSNSNNPICIQDTVHIGTKLRNFFLKTFRNQKMLPFGDFYIEIGHLYELIESFPKDQHELIKNVLNPQDKQNFASVLKMCDWKVITLLRNRIKNSEGTAKFLEILRLILNSFLDMNLTPLERVEKLWYAVFLLRIWRQYIVSSDKTTLKNNFLSNNCFSCVEINAHGLIAILLRLGESNSADLFLPHLFSSQPCESLFRQVRSMTSTQSTVVNFSVKEMLDRINRIQLQSSITIDLSNEYVFPRLGKDNRQHSSIVLPTKLEIGITIEASKKRAFSDAIELGLIEYTKMRPQIPCPVRPIFLEPITKGKPVNLSKMFDSLKFKKIVLKNYATKLQNFAVDETSPYVEVPGTWNKRIVLKKSSLCWLLRDDYCKLSSDRLERVKVANGKVKRRRNTEQTKKKRNYFSHKYKKNPTLISKSKY